MRDSRKFYIDGEWVDPLAPNDFAVESPATEMTIATISLGTAADVDRAVVAARQAFESFSQTSQQERAELLQRITDLSIKRNAELADVITEEMGATRTLAYAEQAAVGAFHFQRCAHLLEDFEFEVTKESQRHCFEPIGVCGLITPWNWPINQLTCKLAPAIAAGCTVVAKPSEVAPLSAMLLAEILEEAGLPRGVFNLVNGDGPIVGAAIASHPDVDMVSITGSVRAGCAVAVAAAPTIKRVTQELGGKSPNIILEDADFEKALPHAVAKGIDNNGQCCDAPTRVIAPNSRMDELVATMKRIFESQVVGSPERDDVTVGPVVSRAQWEKVQGLIQKGIDEGAELVTGGPGKPEGLETGHYVKPTLFAKVTNDMAIAREEIFGPVLVVIGYDDLEEAIQIANDTPYGLAGWVSSGDFDRAVEVGRRIRAGMIFVNESPLHMDGPFGGYKQSGNGREWGEPGLREYLEHKVMFGGGESSSTS